MTLKLAGRLSLLALVAVTAACAPKPLTPSPQHVSRENAPQRPDGDIPPLVFAAPLPPPPQAVQKQETFSVVVNEVPVRDLLFALSRDAKINVDVHPGISGSVTLNALNQTLAQLLSRISRQVDLRWELSGGNLSVLPDTPFLATYTVDYVNISRSAASNVNVASQIGTTGGGTGGAGNNNSSTSLTSNSANFFWESLAQSVCNIVVTTRTISREQRAEQQQARDRDFDNRLNIARQLATAGSGAPQLMQQVTGAAGAGATNSAAPVNCAQTGYNLSQSATGSQTAAAGAANPVISNREGGIIMVFATQRQQEKVREFIDRVVGSARRQVLIEATVVEVQLSGQYQQGINWQRLNFGGSNNLSVTQQPSGSSAALPGGALQGGATGLANANALTRALTLPGATNAGLLQISYLSGNVAAALSLLESFGNVKVLSSPKISVLNNQTAMLKVVDNRVYFTVTATVVPSTVVGVAPTVAYNTTPNTVPVGFVMAVTPQIDDVDQVTINVRPSISRILRFVNDPNPQLAQANVTNPVPEIQTREMESMIKVPNNQIAVMGGLMQDNFNNGEDAIPGLGRLPGVGELFKYRNETSTKSELVIFLRPIVIKDPTLEGDYQRFREYLPGQDFFTRPNPLKPPPVQFGASGSESSDAQKR